MKISQLLSENSKEQELDDIRRKLIAAGIRSGFIDETDEPGGEVTALHVRFEFLELKDPRQNKQLEILFKTLDTDMTDKGISINGYKK